MTQHYIGTKQIMAKPMTRKKYNDLRGWAIPVDEIGREDDPGYMVVYPDSPSNTPHVSGYVSWSPKAVFEAAYLPMGEGSDGSRITEQMVDDFILGHESTRLGNHTVVMVRLRNGFTLIEESACVDPANYDHAIGEEYALAKAKSKVWHLLGFLLATARNGIAPHGWDASVRDETMARAAG